MLLQADVNNSMAILQQFCSNNIISPLGLFLNNVISESPNIFSFQQAVFIKCNAINPSFCYLKSHLPTIREKTSKLVTATKEVCHQRILYWFVMKVGLADTFYKKKHNIRRALTTYVLLVWFIFLHLKSPTNWHWWANFVPKLESVTNRSTALAGKRSVSR